MAGLPLTPSHSSSSLGDISTNYAFSTSALPTKNIGIPSAGNPDSNVQNVIAKPKQSKSRNGCVTCKAKRLKCDEIHPTCQQCQKRGVQCGGYKKEFKWRSFEESSIVTKSSHLSKKVNSTLRVKRASQQPPNNAKVFSSLESSSHQSARPKIHVNRETSKHRVFQGRRNEVFSIEQVYVSTPTDSAIMPAIPEPPALYMKRRSELCNIENNESSTSGEVQLLSLSPRGVSPGTTLDFLELSNGPRLGLQVCDEGLEDMMQTDQSHEWLISAPSPTQSTASTISSDSHSSQGESFIRIQDIFRRPALLASSSEILLSHFDKHTCGIMSVKDGPGENPWRTLIWPMATDSPALYHAISAMTAFHMSRERKQLRVEGMEHMRKSIRFLAQGLSHGNIKQDVALGTTLVLAFSEAFDRHTSTGFEHLRGAKVILNQALSKTVMMSGDVSRFQFLYNVWVYLDVLARLTSNGQDESHATSPNIMLGPYANSAEIDPLLGCAASLFPLIGQAASIVQRVRKTEKNSVGIITDAIQLQKQLEEWMVGEYYEPPEDPSNEVSHCIKTAEAYRWATLLYLHQAVPEIPSLDSHDLAEKVMVLLASIPVSSRSCIVHIYPLLAAGCEAIGNEERSWAKCRWERMQNRLWIGNVDKAWTVTKEVWDRRDRYFTHHPYKKLQLCHRSSLPQNTIYDTPSAGLATIGYSPFSHGDNPSNCPSWDPAFSDTNIVNSIIPTIVKRGNQGSVLDGCNEKDFEYGFTARGKLHWLGVMKDWNWEVLLG
ncbi:fungal-specific transcription factor domain-containing protein [Geopyxis carbonaria]|nr:fungal-specific transcription factor domain-containing protein [Geopyxis carbonaria]